METIIILILTLLPLILKFIGKKFEQSGKADTAEKMRKIVEALGEETDSPFEEWLGGKDSEEEDKAEEQPVVTENVVRQAVPVRKPEAKKTAPVKKEPILIEEASEKKGEKIDPKKLVIYSEIMKPKYTE